MSAEHSKEPDLNTACRRGRVAGGGAGLRSQACSLASARWRRREDAGEPFAIVFRKPVSCVRAGGGAFLQERERVCVCVLLDGGTMNGTARHGTTAARRPSRTMRPPSALMTSAKPADVSQIGQGMDAQRV